MAHLDPAKIGPKPDFGRKKFFQGKFFSKEKIRKNKIFLKKKFYFFLDFGPKGRNLAVDLKAHGLTVRKV